jgi:OmpA-OmpF porin, OOP family
VKIKASTIMLALTLICNTNFSIAKSTADQFVVKGKYDFGWQRSGDYIKKRDINIITNSINSNAPKNAETNRSYQKAKCTIRLANWTFKEVDTKGITEDLVRQSVIFQALSQKNVDPPQITPLPGTPRLYTDRWNKIKQLKQNALCAVPEFDCAEVSLTGAEYESRENYPDHAKHFLDEADKLISIGEKKANQCKQPLPEFLNLSADVLFGFDSSELTPAGRNSIIEFANQLTAHHNKIAKIDIAGFTDRIGSDSYNNKLSKKRAETVRDYLLNYAPLLQAGQLDANGYGKYQPIKNCEGNKVTDELKACLQPNRRVEISIIQQNN